MVAYIRAPPAHGRARVGRSRKRRGELYATPERRAGQVARRLFSTTSPALPRRLGNPPRCAGVSQHLVSGAGRHPPPNIRRWPAPSGGRSRRPQERVPTFGRPGPALRRAPLLQPCRRGEELEAARVRGKAASLSLARLMAELAPTTPPGGGSRKERRQPGRLNGFAVRRRDPPRRSQRPHRVETWQVEPVGLRNGESSASPAGWQSSAA